MDAKILDKPQPRESASGTLPDKWDYKTFKDYLLALSRGPEFVLATNEFPTQFELSPEWHQTLNKMRLQTASNGKEHYAGIAYKDDRSGLYLPTSPDGWSPNFVPSLLVNLHEQHMKFNGKMVGIVGDIHTHPREPVPSKIEDLLRYKKEDPAFSAGDLFGMLVTNPRPVRTVVDGSYNLIAFRTAETKQAKSNLTQENFERYWYEKNGWKYQGNIEKNGAQRATPSTKSSNQDVNRQIAEAHKLVIYKGKQNEPLKRIYPDVPKPARLDPFVTKR